MIHKININQLGGLEITPGMIVEISGTAEKNIKIRDQKLPSQKDSPYAFLDFSGVTFNGYQLVTRNSRKLLYHRAKVDQTEQGNNCFVTEDDSNKIGYFACNAINGNNGFFFTAGAKNCLVQTGIATGATNDAFTCHKRYSDKADSGDGNVFINCSGHAEEQLLDFTSGEKHVAIECSVDQYFDATNSVLIGKESQASIYHLYSPDSTITVRSDKRNIVQGGHFRKLSIRKSMSTGNLPGGVDYYGNRIRHSVGNPDNLDMDQYLTVYGYTEHIIDYTVRNRVKEMNEAYRKLLADFYLYSKLG